MNDDNGNGDHKWLPKPIPEPDTVRFGQVSNDSPIIHWARPGTEMTFTEGKGEVQPGTMQAGQKLTWQETLSMKTEETKKKIFQFGAIRDRTHE